VNGLFAVLRHSGMLSAGIQARARARYPCGWIPAKSMRGDGSEIGHSFVRSRISSVVRFVPHGFTADGHTLRFSIIDRGRGGALVCTAPTSEPCIRISRTLCATAHNVRYVKAALMLHRVSILLCFELFFSVDVT